MDPDTVTEASSTTVRCPACGTPGAVVNGVMVGHQEWASGETCWAEGFPADRVMSAGLFWLAPDTTGNALPAARANGNGELVVERGSLAHYGAEASVPFVLRSPRMPGDHQARVHGQTRWVAARPRAMSVMGTKLVANTGFVRVAGPFRVGVTPDGQASVSCEGCDWHQPGCEPPVLESVTSGHRCPEVVGPLAGLRLDG